MAVERENTVTLTLDNQAYFFCAKGCRDEFAANPELFLQKVAVKVVTGNYLAQ